MNGFLAAGLRIHGRFAMDFDRKPNPTSEMPGGCDVASAQPDTDPADAKHADAKQADARGRREFLGKSGRLLIYVPPLIQLFIPTKALAASPSS